MTRGMLRTVQAKSSPKYNWLQQWYPIQYLENLDEAVPYPFTLLEQRLVMFRDAAGMWRTLLDSCPHRFAPLSGEACLSKQLGMLLSTCPQVKGHQGPANLHQCLPEYW